MKNGTNLEAMSYLKQKKITLDLGSLELEMPVEIIIRQDKKLRKFVNFLPTNDFETYFKCK